MSSTDSKSSVAIEPIAAFGDNYIWLLTCGGRAVVVDPGDAAPVRQVLAARRLQLEGILVTHHHPDHVGGLAELVADHAPEVFVPAGEDIATGAARARRLREGDRIEVLGEVLHVLDVPGHTAGHVAYHAPALQALFCGDTLFAGGCGRLFEGTPAQMLASLQKLARLPGTTRVYCAHEYTLSNLRFARAVEPDNEALRRREHHCRALRERSLPTVPSTIDEERATNPFLRSDAAAVRAAAQAREPGAGASDVGTFAAIRAWKNTFV